jgi:hypothetical protein
MRIVFAVAVSIRDLQSLIADQVIKLWDLVFKQKLIFRQKKNICKSKLTLFKLYANTPIIPSRG